MAAPQFDPTKAASLAAMAQSALNHGDHAICDTVAKHVREQVQVNDHQGFYKAVSKTLREDHGIQMGHNEVREKYGALRKWAIDNRTGKDGDERAYIQKVTRKDRRKQKAKFRQAVEGVASLDLNKQDEDEDEDEDDSALPASGFAFSLPDRTKDQ